MRLEGLLFYIFIFILGPIIRGLLESEKTKKSWKEKQQKLPKMPLPTMRFPMEDSAAEEYTTERPRSYKSAATKRLNRINSVTDKAPQEQSKLVDVLSQITQNSPIKATPIPTTEKPSTTKSDRLGQGDFGLGELNGHDLLKGIILAEILGPPKALSGDHR